MSQVTIESFAKQIGITEEKLLDQLVQAGISGKAKTDMLEDDEKITLLQYLKGGGPDKQESRGRISLKRKTTDAIRQTSRTGAAHTVHVEVKKRRTFVKRSVLEAEQAEIAAKEAEQEAERKQEAKEQQRLEAAQMAEIEEQCDDKHQVILSTHSAFVLNKLGIDNLRLISQAGKAISLGDLDPKTTAFFKKLPGYDRSLSG